jgi:hypothetical protein|tara:strand:- start:214 stop:618 length:405 start_codon:yes stop_codon:yes gene_type:complete
MRTLLTFFTAAVVSTLLIVSTSLGQVSSGIPMVNFICAEPEPLSHIMQISYKKDTKGGGKQVNKYFENEECWSVNPTLVEVIKVIEESFDPEGRLWAIVAVKPHRQAGFTKQYQTRYAILDAAIAKAYIRRHSP